MKQIARNDLFYFSGFIVKKSRFHLKRQPLEKVVINQEEADGIHIYDIRNLEDSPRLLSIHEECENLIVVKVLHHQ